MKRNVMETVTTKMVNRCFKEFRKGKLWYSGVRGWKGKSSESDETLPMGKLLIQGEIGFKPSSQS